ncbi:hypothetical protein LEN26_009699 [Aphanomyces euteiches]|nr:hypothetical protein AeMF1_021889 [Aphanomyces euteiches]KAH9124502.1 hypothetical protein LEN26_009699 [Aphanomyces euteiches]KAH9184334.1 hypothetical protein AeNC1_013690 [Aphanomyces euteiches]
MSRWTSEDDMALLIQVNNERPFVQTKGVMRAWGVLAQNLLNAPGFTRGQDEIDGKRVSYRFHLLLDKHEKIQKESVYLSGVDQEYSDRHILLDELVALRTECIERKKGLQQANLAKKNDKAMSEAGARHIRDEAMKTCSKKRKNNKVDDENQEATPSKKKILGNFHDEEVRLERERLALKKEKLALEYEEKQRERDERREIREADRKQREEDGKQISEMMALVRAALEKSQSH